MKSGVPFEKRHQQYKEIYKKRKEFLKDQAQDYELHRYFHFGNPCDLIHLIFENKKLQNLFLNKFQTNGDIETKEFNHVLFIAAMVGIHKMGEQPIIQEFYRKIQHFPLNLVNILQGNRQLNTLQFVNHLETMDFELQQVVFTLQQLFNFNPVLSTILLTYPDNLDFRIFSDLLQNFPLRNLKYFYDEFFIFMKNNQNQINKINSFDLMKLCDIEHYCLEDNKKTELSQYLFEKKLTLNLEQLFKNGQDNNNKHDLISRLPITSIIIFWGFRKLYFSKYNETLLNLKTEMLIQKKIIQKYQENESNSINTSNQEQLKTSFNQQKILIDQLISKSQNCYYQNIFVIDLLLCVFERCQVHFFSETNPNNIELFDKSQLLTFFGLGMHFTQQQNVNFTKDYLSNLVFVFQKPSLNFQAQPFIQMQDEKKLVGSHHPIQEIFKTKYEQIFKYIEYQSNYEEDIIQSIQQNNDAIFKQHFIKRNYQQGFIQNIQEVLLIKEKQIILLNSLYKSKSQFIEIDLEIFLTNPQNRFYYKLISFDIAEVCQFVQQQFINSSQMNIKIELIKAYIDYQNQPLYEQTFNQQFKQLNQILQDFQIESYPFFLRNFNNLPIDIEYDVQNSLFNLIFSLNLKRYLNEQKDFQQIQELINCVDPNFLFFHDSNNIHIDYIKFYEVDKFTSVHEIYKQKKGLLRSFIFQTFKQLSLNPANLIIQLIFAYIGNLKGWIELYAIITNKKKIQPHKHSNLEFSGYLKSFLMSLLHFLNKFKQQYLDLQHYSIYKAINLKNPTIDEKQFLENLNGENSDNSYQDFLQQTCQLLKIFEKKKDSILNNEYIIEGLQKLIPQQEKKNSEYILIFQSFLNIIQGNTHLNYQVGIRDPQKQDDQAPITKDYQEQIVLKQKTMNFNQIQPFNNEVPESFKETKDNQFKINFNEILDLIRNLNQSSNFCELISWLNNFSQRNPNIIKDQNSFLLCLQGIYNLVNWEKLLDKKTKEDQDLQFAKISSILFLFRYSIYINKEIFKERNLDNNQENINIEDLDLELQKLGQRLLQKKDIFQPINQEVQGDKNVEDANQQKKKIQLSDEEIIVNLIQFMLNDLENNENNKDDQQTDFFKIHDLVLQIIYANTKEQKIQLSSLIEQQQTFQILYNKTIENYEQNYPSIIPLLLFKILQNLHSSLFDQQIGEYNQRIKQFKEQEIKHIIQDYSQLESIQFYINLIKMQNQPTEKFLEVYQNDIDKILHNKNAQSLIKCLMSILFNKKITELSFGNILSKSLQVEENLQVIIDKIDSFKEIFLCFEKNLDQIFSEDELSLKQIFFIYSNQFYKKTIDLLQLQQVNCLQQETLEAILNQFNLFFNFQFSDINVDFFQIFNIHKNEAQQFLAKLVQLHSVLNIPTDILKNKIQSYTHESVIKANQIQQLFQQKLFDGKQMVLTDVFQLIDRDGSNFISIEEFQTFMNRIGLKFSQSKVKEILVRAVKNPFNTHEIKIDKKQFEKALTQISIITMELALTKLGISKDMQRKAFILLVFYLIILIAFLLIGIHAFAIPGTFGSVVNSLLPISNINLILILIQVGGTGLSNNFKKIGDKIKNNQELREIVELSFEQTKKIW